VPTDADSIFLDDLTVGQTFTSEEHQLDPEQVIAFARQFDPQPFHLDEEAAKRTFFKGLVASGWHTAAITMKLLVSGGAPITGGVIGAGVEVEWPRPTQPNDRLHVESEVVDIRPSRSKPDRGIVILRTKTINQDGEVVQLLTSRLVVPRRPADPVGDVQRK
jgi:acyl dehydratase